MRLLFPILLIISSTILKAQDNPTEALTQVRMLLKKKQPKEAISILQAIKNTNSESLTSKETGTLYYLTGQAQKNLRLYEEAVGSYETALSKSEGLDTLAAKIQYQLGMTNYRLSRFAVAGQFMQKASDAFQEVYGENSKNYLASLNTLGFLYNVQAKYSRAEKTFRKARQINFRITGGENMQYARITNNLADVYCNLNRYDKAYELYQTSLRIKEKISGKESIDYAKTLYNLADFHGSLGQFEKEEIVIKEGIEIFESLKKTEHPDFLKFLDHLANLYQKTENFSEAEKLHTETLQRREASGATEQAEYALNLINLSALYFKQKKYDQALDLAEKALPLAEKIYGINHPTYAGVLTTLGDIQSEKGDSENAANHYKEAIRIIQRSLGKKHIEYFNTQFAYARFLRKVGNKKEAVRIYKKIDKIPQNYLKRAVRFLSEKELSDKVFEYKSFSEEIYSFLREVPEDSDLSVLAYNSVLYYRGFILNNLQRIRKGISKARSVSDASDKVISLHRQLENELNKPIEEQKNVKELEHRISTEESSIAEMLGSFSEAEDEVNWEEVQLALADDEAAVEFLAFQDPAAKDSVIYGVLFLTSYSDTPGFAELCSEADFAGLFPGGIERKADYISKVYDFSSRGLRLNNGNEKSLTELIWLPLKNRLPEIKKIYTVPAGILHRISLAALPIDLESVIADSVELFLVGSTRQIIPNDDEIFTFSGEDVLVLGGIEYDFNDDSKIASRAGKTNWNYLPWTAKESQEVSNLLQKASYNVNYLNGVDATEKKVVNTLEKSEKKWRVLHIATHGYFSDAPENNSETGAGFYGTGMLNSGLVLAGVNRSDKKPTDDDGLLTAYEVSRLDLKQTELVVLSACETALGDLINEEGVYGLQRAFKLAGADKLIMSLWQIPDRETKEFMVTFYKNYLDRKMSVRAAFNKTQKEMRERFVNPYQWAGFVLLE